jgi:hypothetical protein
MMPRLALVLNWNIIEPIPFGPVGIRWAALESCPAFQQAVLRAEHGIPRGRVICERFHSQG